MLCFALDLYQRFFSRVLPHYTLRWFKSRRLAVYTQVPIQLTILIDCWYLADVTPALDNHLSARLTMRLQGDQNSRHDPEELFCGFSSSLQGWPNKPVGKEGECSTVPAILLVIGFQPYVIIHTTIKEHHRYVLDVPSYICVKRVS
jgi:hypothetical protein